MSTLETTAIPNEHDMGMHHATLNSTLAAIDRIPMWEVSGPIALDLGAISASCSVATALLDRNRSIPGAWARIQLFAQIKSFHEMAAAKEVAFTAEFDRLYSELARRS